MLNNQINKQDYHKPVSTNNETAQAWIDYGLMNMWGFNHYGGIKCFIKALEYDKNCCFIYWALAYAYGPHYNAMGITIQDYETGLKYLKQAQLHKQNGLQWEKDLINILELRYPPNFREQPEESLKSGLILFCKQMKKIYEKYPEDIEITALYAQSVMNLNPWKLWLKSGAPTPQAVIARQVLQKSIKKSYHPQTYHLYIHLMELSPQFKLTVPIIKQLYSKIKSIAHLLHMPSHIYIQLGDYHKSLQCNLRAVQADKNTVQLLNTQLSFYQFYRAHNIHFAIWAAMFLGDYGTAMKYSIMIKELVDEKVLSRFGNQAEFYVSSDLHVMIRFGKWQQILDHPIQTRQKFPLYKTSQRYSRAIAYAVLGKIKQADEELELFKSEREKIVDRTYGNNSYQDVFAVAEAMALGQILYRKGQYEEAFKYLRKSVVLSDNLVYDEPWSWMQPARHALGALLTEQGHFQQAQRAYLEDLKTYPDNIWSLVGLDEVYQKQGKKKQRQSIREALELAKKNSKQPIKVSCFCKKH